MGALSPLRKDEEPVNIGDRAIDNVRYIREMMERSASFTAVPGYGGMLMGATAVAAAYIASTQADIASSLTTWLAEAFLAFSIGLLAVWQKSKIAGGSLLSTPARKFALGFAPPLIVGVIIVLGLWKNGEVYVMAPVCMATYGAAIVCGGAYSVRAVPIMGWSFIAAGAVAFALPAAYGNLMMGATFGLLHVIFGAIIARKYGG